jgi:hypothetical protein
MISSVGKFILALTPFGYPALAAPRLKTDFHAIKKPRRLH